jgi:hypothetical protein
MSLHRHLHPALDVHAATQDNRPDRFAPATRPLQRELEFFNLNEAELLKSHGGKVIVIKGETVLGDYSTVEEAVAHTTQRHPVGTFLVQQMASDMGGYTYTRGYRSLVAFY